MDATQLKQAGFSDQEIGEYTNLQSAGFSPEEIEKHYSQKPTPTPETPVSWRDQMRITREKAQAGFKSDLLNLLSFAGKPQEAGQMLGTALATPEGREELIKPIRESIINPAGIPERIGRYAEEHPLNTALNILPFAGLATKAGALTRAAAESKLAGALESPASAILAADKYAGGSTSPLREVVNYGMQKGVRPSVAGKGSWEQVKKSERGSESAVKSIIDNKDNLTYTKTSGEVVKGKLPSNLGEFSDAIHQTMKSIHERYSSMSGQAVEKVRYEPVAKELEKALNNPEMINHKETYKYLQEKIADYRQWDETFGGLTPSETEGVIADLNRGLKTHYKNPNYDNVSKAAIDEMVARNLRKGLDDVVSRSQGPGYQELKNEYGNLRSIEKDVTHRYIVDARKNVKGIFDISSVWSGVELATGLMTLNPTHIGRAVAIEAVRKGIKWANDPNRYISNMFKDAEKVYTPSWWGQSTPLRDIPISNQLGLPPGPERKLLNAPGAVNPEFTFRPPGTILRKGYEVGIAPKEADVFTVGPNGELIPQRLSKTPTQGEIPIVGVAPDRIKEALGKPAFMRTAEDRLILQEAAKVTAQPIESLVQGRAFNKRIAGENPEKLAVTTISEPGKPPTITPPVAEKVPPAPSGEVSKLPEWVREGMLERGLDPKRIFNDVDLGNPSVRRAIELDPTLTPEQKATVLKIGSKEVPKAKEPWEMTKEEYLNDLAKVLAESATAKSGRQPNYKLARGMVQPQDEINHKNYVKQALSEGKPVPPEALKDYPELAPKPPTEPGKVGEGSSYTKEMKKRADEQYAGWKGREQKIDPLQTHELIESRKAAETAIKELNENPAFDWSDKGKRRSAINRYFEERVAKEEEIFKAPGVGKVSFGEDVARKSADQAEKIGSLKSGEEEFAKLLKKAKQDEIKRWMGLEGVEHTEVKVEPAKVGKVESPKEQKKYLVDAIDEAIKDAPKLGKEGEYAIIEIPGDGIFKILNNKNALAEFKNKSKSFPGTATTTEPRKPFQPSFKPTGKRIADFEGEYYNEFKPRKEGIIESPENKNFYNEGWYSNGYYAIKIEKPTIKGIWKEGEQPDIKATIPTGNLVPAEIVGENYQGGDFVHAHFLSKTGESAFVNAKFVDSVLTKYPDAKPFIQSQEGGPSPVLFRSKGEPVAVVMPMRIEADMPRIAREYERVHGKPLKSKSTKEE